MIEKYNENKLYSKIKELIIASKNNIYKQINTTIVKTYWQIGKYIVEYKQSGKEKTNYKDYLITDLSKKLTTEFGIGFSISNLKNCRQFYLTYKIGSTVSSQLTWTHYRLLIRVENKLARKFYEIETIKNNWSTRELYN